METHNRLFIYVIVRFFSGLKGHEPAIDIKNIFLKTEKYCVNYVFKLDFLKSFYITTF